MDATLRALLRADFDWTSHIEAIWQSSETDVEELQAEAREDLEMHLEDLDESASLHSPLGVPLLGMAGSGKTHLLGIMRQRAFAHRAWFVLVDLTDVSDFWETVLLGYLRSLQQPGPDSNKRQLDSWLDDFVGRFGQDQRRRGKIPEQRPPGLINTCDALVTALGRKHREEAREHADVLRALVLFACDHSEINDLGYKWLQGIGIDEDEKQHHGFREAQRSPARIVGGLSWLLSLAGPTVLALDQLDAIVAEHNLASATDGQEPTAQQQASLAIIQGIGGGLMALRDVTRRTLTIVSALHATWKVLITRAVAAMGDRYNDPLRIDPATAEQSFRRLVEQRLAPAYHRAEIAPPYPTYPFTGAFFEKHRSGTPRDLLKACDAHRRACRKAGVVTETEVATTPPPPPSPGDFATLESRLDTLRAQANIEDILTDKSERKLDKLIETACSALLHENPTIDSVIPRVDKDFIGTGNYDPLHARIRLILTHENERERHLAFRSLQQEHHRAFQSRLKAAITASGIDHKLDFRRLTLFRVGPVPGKTATRKLLDELTSKGGRLLEPGEDELRTLWALSQLIDVTDEPRQLEAWLQDQRPVSQLPSFREAAAWLFEGLRKPTEGSPAKKTNTVEKQPKREPETQPRPNTSTALPFGHTDRGEVSVELGSLANHACVLAGTGSGKTVFLRRVVEEAAIAGVPSIVLDGANDLARLGDPWPERPSAFREEDVAKSTHYHAQTEVVVWTPGLVTGCPLVLNPIPDFRTLTGDSDEARDQFNAAVAMAVASLAPIAAPGSGARATKARAILTAAVQRFGARKGGSLHDLIELMREPSDDIIEGYKDGHKIAQDIAELLYASTKNDPLIGGEGTPLDPTQLLRASVPDKQRISVINLSGLQGLDVQQKFVNQLAMTLFTHIKQHPAKPGRLLGLFVIDEAKDFMPSNKSTACKENLVRLVAQARKYGLGMLFASQAPKSIDHNIVANCSTLLVGKANSPTAIETVQRLLQEKGGIGGVGHDVGKLKTGVFYASTHANPKPVKVQTPLCLSYHPSSPPEQSEVLQRAKISRRHLG